MEPMTSIPTNFPTTELILPGAEAFSTLRDCRDAGDPYDGFNACHYTGAPEADVMAAREALAARLDVSPSHLIIPRQTHSLNIATIDDDFDFRQLEDTDGAVTRRRDVVLCINTADCVPVVLCDAVAGVIGAVHSGWRGTIGRIAARAVEAMCRIGALPQHIHVAMGPCICAGCYEVGPEVAEQFRCEFPFYPGIVLTGYPKPHIDLAEAIRDTLIDAGVATGSIQMPPACSKCNPRDYFSARRLGVCSGRTLTAIALTERDAEMRR